MRTEQNSVVEMSSIQLIELNNSAETGEGNITDAQYVYIEHDPLVEMTTISLKQLKESFTIQLQQIKNKEIDLRQEGHVVAADAANILYKKIKQIYKEVLPSDAEQFKKECQHAIDEARPQLESHRGWKLTLSYLTLTATGLGVLVVLADIGHKLITGKHFSFFQTDAAQKLSALEEKIDEIAVLVI